MRRTAATASFLVALTFFTPGARAEAPGFQKHDGLLLRLTTGVGYGYASATSGGKSYSMQGVSGITDVGIGYCVIENLALTFDIFGGMQISPKFTRDGDSRSFSDAQLISAGFWLGATYYIMPLNLYLSLALGGSRMSLEYRAAGATVKGETKTGFGMHFGVGKEWWVSDN